jgi:Family of unknown function (DUF5715)
MKYQHEVAIELHYTFLRTPDQVRDYVAKGRLETLAGNADYLLAGVSFPYARTEVRRFVERLAADYHAATGSKLVVTSLTRPGALQPRNASELSVHPAGMAVDLRVPEDTASRRWLEATLLSLENARLLDATREHYPPHYHVAVFPEPYRVYADRRDAADAIAAATKATSLAAAAVAPTLGPGIGAPSALPVLPLVGGAVSGFLSLGFIAAGGAIAGARRRRAG